LIGNSGELRADWKVVMKAQKMAVWKDGNLVVMLVVL